MKDYTIAHYRIMQRVVAGSVLWHSTTEPHCPGFSWQSSDMSAEVLDIMDELLAAGHVFVGVHSTFGSPVFQTELGTKAMGEHMASINRALRRAS